MFKVGDIIKVTSIDWKRDYYDNLTKMNTVPKVGAVGRVCNVGEAWLTIQVVEQTLQQTLVVKEYQVLQTEIESVAITNSKDEVKVSDHKVWISSVEFTLPNGEQLEFDAIELELSEVQPYLKTLAEAVVDASNKVNVVEVKAPKKTCWRTLTITNPELVDELKYFQRLEFIKFIRTFAEVHWNVAKDYVDSMHDELHSDSPHPVKFMAVLSNDDAASYRILKCLEDFGFNVACSVGDDNCRSQRWDFIVEI